MQLRKLLCLVAFAAALGVLAGAGRAQTGYPSAPVRVIIPLAPGGAIDVMVRALGKAFEQRNPHGFIVESRPAPIPSSQPMPARRRRRRLYDLSALAQQRLAQSDALQEPVL